MRIAVYVSETLGPLFYLRGTVVVHGIPRATKTEMAREQWLLPNPWRIHSVSASNIRAQMFHQHREKRATVFTQRLSYRSDQLMYSCHSRWNRLMSMKFCMEATAFRTTKETMFQDAKHISSYFYKSMWIQFSMDFQSQSCLFLSTSQYLGELTEPRRWYTCKVMSWSKMDELWAVHGEAQLLNQNNDKDEPTNISNIFKYDEIWWNNIKYQYIPDSTTAILHMLLYLGPVLARQLNFNWRLGGLVVRNNYFLFASFSELEVSLPRETSSQGSHRTKARGAVDHKHPGQKSLLQNTGAAVH